MLLKLCVCFLPWESSLGCILSISIEEHHRVAWKEWHWEESIEEKHVKSLARGVPGSSESLEWEDKQRN